MSATLAGPLDLAQVRAVALAPGLLVVRGPRSGLTVWRIGEDRIARQYLLARPSPAPQRAAVPEDA